MQKDLENPLSILVEEMYSKVKVRTLTRTTI